MSRSAGLTSDYELDRIAIAVDALTFGSTRPLLVHVAGPVMNSQPGDHEPTVLGIDPWEATELDRLEQPEAFAATAPQAWSVLGIVAPVSVATDHVSRGAHNNSQRDGWLVHLVDRQGRSSTRIWSQDGRPALQSMDVIGGRIDQYCRRRLGLPEHGALAVSH